jgi:alpha-tubulin suppressor-like RCC1 family protein
VSSEVRCWGSNDVYQLGIADALDRREPAVRDTADPVRLYAGYTHGCELRGDALYCWGGNDYGQVGNGSMASQMTPAQVGVRTWTSTDGACDGAYQTCAIDSVTGLVWCWGAGGSGQLGDGTMTTSTIEVQALMESATMVATGAGHTCAIATFDSSVYCWGYNADGELGLGVDDLTEHDAPIQIPGSSAASLDAGGWHTCSFDAGGIMSCWGWNGYGQLGDGTRENRPVPTAINGFTWSLVSAGREHTCAIDTGARLFCWGANYYGQAGAPAEQAVVLTPRQVGDAQWKAVDAAQYHTCGIQIDDTVWCWGHNITGAIGDGGAWRPTLGPVGR